MIKAIVQNGEKTIFGGMKAKFGTFQKVIKLCKSLQKDHGCHGKENEMKKQLGSWYEMAVCGCGGGGGGGGEKWSQPVIYIWGKSDGV